MFFPWVDKPEKLKDSLLQLTNESKCTWGRMDAQQMVEHLLAVFELSSEEKVNPILTPDKYIEKSQAFLMSDEPMPQNFVAKFLPEKPVVHSNKNFNLAVNELVSALHTYHSYWLGKEERTLNHPVFGKLNKKMWDQVHNKHITHHLLQFGLSR